MATILRLQHRAKLVVMRIDSHQHYWLPKQVDYFWMTPGHPVLDRPYLPSDLEPILERNHFDGTVVVQAAHDLREADWLLELAGQHASILGVVAWADLTSSGLGHTLDALQRRVKFKGVRHILHDEPDVNWGLRSDVRQGLKELERRGIPFDLLVRPTHLHIVEPLAEALPELPLVIDHIAKPNIADGVFDGWAQQMERIARIPRLHVKLSGMITEAKHDAWKMEDLRPYVQLVLEKFGADRLMFGSDWPVCLLAGSWKQVLAALTQALGPLPHEVREKIMGDTAARFYRLDAPAA